MAASSKGRADSTGRVLEKVDRRSTLDDTLPIKATIVTQRTAPSGHTEFVTRVHRGSNQDESWDVTHRYSEFDTLNGTLQSLGYKFTLPPKTLFRNTTKEFLAERQAGLQKFLDEVLEERLLMMSLPVRRFLDPDNYTQNFHDEALRSVSMFFRSNPEWSIVEPMRDIGWRIRKHYYIISSKVNPSQPKQLLSHLQAGPDFNIDEKELELLLKILVDLKHPNILSPCHATLYSSAGLCVARPFFPTGSLRDKIYQVPPQKVTSTSYLTKYNRTTPRANRATIEFHDIRRYGRHILDGLKYLMDRGFVLGHVHCGNVVLVDDVCKLTDLENSLMGIPPYYRQYVIELRKIQGQEAEAVYAFGHLLYEMACCEPLTTPTMDSPPPVRNDVISNILASILSPAGIKSLPTLADLLANEFFKDIAGAVGEKPSLKVPSRLKESVKAIREKYDTRLVDNQRKAVQQRRMSKAHDTLMSTDKKKDRRKKMKKEMSLQETETTKDGDSMYPKAKLKRHSTIGEKKQYSPPVIIKSESNNTTKANSTSSAKAEPAKKKTSTAPAAPPPPTTQPPEPRPTPPPNRSGNERGALLGSIESFAKGKLKKAVTNDRSAPKL